MRTLLLTGATGLVGSRSRPRAGAAAAIHGRPQRVRVAEIIANAGNPQRQLDIAADECTAIAAGSPAPRPGAPSSPPHLVSSSQQHLAVQEGPPCPHPHP